MPREAFQERVSKVIDPLYLRELVRDCIEHELRYIFIDTELDLLIDGVTSANQRWQVLLLAKMSQLLSNSS